MVIRLPSKRKILIYCQLLLIFTMLWLRDILGFSSSITYLTDLILVLIIIFNFNKIKHTILDRKWRKQIIIFALIIICVMFGVILNFVNPLHFLWGVRNNLRFFIFFFICVVLLDKDDIYSLIKMIKIFFFLNVLMCLYQYFVMGLSNDYLGGFFGISQGCNTYINVLLCIICSLIVGEYLWGKRKMKSVVVYSSLCLGLAYFCELKVFFVEFLVIFFISFLITKPSKKTMIIILSGVIIISVLINILMKYSPESLSLLFDADARQYYLSGNGYTNSGDLNRFTALSTIYNMFFEGNILLQLFGFGMGNCDTSSFSFLQSQFSKTYEYLHYRWFSHAWVYLEQGLFGIVLMLLFFISIFIYSWKTKKENGYLNVSVIAFIITCLIGIIYNCSLQMDISYLIAFVLSIPFILKKQGKIRKNNVEKCF